MQMSTDPDAHDVRACLPLKHCNCPRNGCNRPDGHETQRAVVAAATAPAAAAVVVAPPRSCRTSVKVEFCSAPNLPAGQARHSKSSPARSSAAGRRGRSSASSLRP